MKTKEKLKGNHRNSHDIIIAIQHAVFYTRWNGTIVWESPITAFENVAFVE